MKVDLQYKWQCHLDHPLLNHDNILGGVWHYLSDILNSPFLIWSQSIMVLSRVGVIQCRAGEGWWLGLAKWGGGWNRAGGWRWQPEPSLWSPCLLARWTWHPDHPDLDHLQCLSPCHGQIQQFPLFSAAISPGSSNLLSRQLPGISPLLKVKRAHREHSNCDWHNPVILHTSHVVTWCGPHSLFHLVIPLHQHLLWAAKTEIETWKIGSFSSAASLGEELNCYPLHLKIIWWGKEWARRKMCVNEKKNVMKQKE